MQLLKAPDMSRPRVIFEPSRITVTFDRCDYESVEAIAAARRDTKSGVVRKAIREWLKSGSAEAATEVPRALGKD